MYEQRVIATESDFAAATQLISGHWAKWGAKSEMHIGDLFWGCFSKACVTAKPVCRTWHVDSTIHALAMVSTNGWCDAVIHPTSINPHLLGEIIRFAEDAVKRIGCPTVRIGRRLTGAVWEQQLLTKGYVRMKHGYPTLHKTLHDEELQPTSLDGFQLCDMPQSDVGSDEYAIVWNNAFPNELRTASDVESLQKCRAYCGELDLMCVSSNGTVAAFCTMWLDASNRAGLFEPVGCHRKYRRRGLSRALVIEGCRRLRERGAHDAYVRVHDENHSALRFYKACGFHQASSDFGFQKHIS